MLLHFISLFDRRKAYPVRYVLFLFYTHPYLHFVLHPSLHRQDLRCVTLLFSPCVIKIKIAVGAIAHLPLRKQLHYNNTYLLHHTTHFLIFLYKQ
nr:MAG TPA: hypothetical protein [Caudoviricetes sp.]